MISTSPVFPATPPTCLFLNNYYTRVWCFPRLIAWLLAWQGVQYNIYIDRGPDWLVEIIISIIIISLFHNVALSKWRHLFSACMMMCRLCCGLSPRPTGQKCFVSDCVLLIYGWKNSRSTRLTGQTSRFNIMNHLHTTVVSGVISLTDRKLKIKNKQLFPDCSVGRAPDLPVSRVTYTCNTTCSRNHANHLTNPTVRASTWPGLSGVYTTTAGSPMTLPSCGWSSVTSNTFWGV